MGYEQVYRNGVLLSRGNDYTATDGTTITLIDATIAGDIIEVFANELVPLTDAISKGQFTAKGALLSATAASTPAVLTVGSNNQVLTADSTTSTGLKWAAVSSADALLTIEESTYFIMPQFTSSTGATLTANTTYYIPIYLPTCSLDRIGFTAATYSVTGATRLGIYNTDTSGKPSTVLLDAGTVSPTANAQYTITISQNITAGWYYLALNKQGGTYNIETFNVAQPYVNYLQTTLASGGQTIAAFTQASVTGAFATATSLTAVSGTTARPIIGVRIA